jgi:hypothetical protein
MYNDCTTNANATLGSPPDCTIAVALPGGSPT